jgi:hypothetical protein
MSSPSEDYSHFYSQQIEAGDHVLTHLKNGSYHILLEADLQAGKTGCYNYVIRKMLKENIVKRAIVICGSSELQLKEQAETDIRHYNYDLGGKIKVHFRQDLKKIEKGVKDCLIIHEESHLVQTKNQTIHKQSKRLDIPFGGEIGERGRNNYILSVSATPFSEKSDIIHGKSHFSKKIVKMKPGDGYIGISFFYSNNAFKEKFEITEDIVRFKDLILSKGKKWNLIRIFDTKGKITTPLLFELKHYGIDVTLYDSHHSKIESLDFLNEIPDKPSLVILKGLCRVGKVIAKQNIGFIWENADKPKTDTILQALPGRCCGYHTNIHIDMYVSPTVLRKRPVTGFEEELDEIEMYLKGLVPNNGTNIKKVRLDKKQKDYVTTIPIKINKMDLIENGRFDIDSQMDSLPDAKRDFIEFLLENDRFLDSLEDKKTRVLEILDELKNSENSFIDCNVALNIHKNNQYRGKLVDWVTAFNNKEPYRGNHKANSQSKPFKMFISPILNNYNERYLCGANHGDIFIGFNLNTDLLTPEELGVTITPPTNGKEIFRMGLNLDSTEETEQHTILVGTSLHWPNNWADNPHMFKKHLSNTIKNQQNWVRDGLLRNKRIEFNGFEVKTDKYFEFGNRNILSTFNIILAELENKYKLINLKFNFQLCRGRHSQGMTKLNFLEYDDTFNPLIHSEDIFNSDLPLNETRDISPTDLFEENITLEVEIPDE